MKATIRVWDGDTVVDHEVDALPTGVPGLVIHRSFDDGWSLMISHVASGLGVAEFDAGVFACAEALGELGSWEAAPGQAMIDKATKIIQSYDAWIGPTSAPADVKRAEQERAGVPVAEQQPAVRGHLSAVPRG